MHQLQTILSVLKLFELSVGRDGRNRTVYWAFAAYTSRNQPGNSKFIFGPDRSFRSLIKPAPGEGVAYLDFRNQEFAIASVLSDDKLMQDDYRNGDPYLILAKKVGMIPPDGTKKSHPDERHLCKTCILGILYGQGELGLSTRLNIPPVYARELLREFSKRYRIYWKWRDDYVRSSTALGYVSTVFGWRAWVSADFNHRSIQNFPCQANAAEMLRLACCKGVLLGVNICCPVHDAVLIVAPLDRLDADIEKMRLAMAEASCEVLDGFEIDVEVDQIVRAGDHPDHYIDERGIEMWDRLMEELERAEEKESEGG
jgi:DNA polymerase I